jgi:hypothetical protein
MTASAGRIDLGWNDGFSTGDLDPYQVAISGVQL